MSNFSTLMLLTTETSLHAGSGQSVAGIDLPIQREIHTHWPCVYGSAVKGALRAHAENLLDASAIIELFGPDHAAAEKERDSSHAGALLIGDAQLLALPVRSLQSCFKWVTSPASIQRFMRNCARLGVATPSLTVPTVQATQALGQSDEALFLEEFRLAQSPNETVKQLAQWLHELSDQELKLEELSERLVIVHDDIFSFLTRYATAINPHIALDSQTKSVKNGALWYEESLPPETLMYVPVAAHASRKKGSDLQAADILQQFTDLFPKGSHWLQIGGNETTGMGWCRISLNAAQQEA